MTAWIGLLKKEFRLSRPLVIIGLFLLSIAIISSLMIQNRFPEHTLLLPLAIGMIAAHGIYLAIYMLFSLYVESKQLHLWLHNPQPAIRLLLAKLVTGLTAMGLSLFIALLFSYYSLTQLYTTSELSALAGEVLWVAFLVFTAMMMTALYAGVWVTTLWAIYHTLRTWIGKWSWLVVIGVFIGSGWLLAKLESSAFFAKAVDWGNIPIKAPLGLIELFNPGFTIEATSYLPAGFIVYNALLVTGLFLVSSWLIDKKVEV